jgi:hypothetical protein
MSKKQEERTRPMELIFAQGEAIDQDGEMRDRPALAIEQAEDGLVVDIRADLGNDDNENPRSVNLMIPLHDLYEALAFLTRTAPKDDA